MKINFSDFKFLLLLLLFFNKTVCFQPTTALNACGFVYMTV